MFISKNGKKMTVITFALALLLSGAAARADGPADCSNIQTGKGKVSGVINEKEKLCTYKGVPFAAPPVGELRFAPPQEHAPWTETLKADRYGGACLQNVMSLFPTDKVVGSEDCLYLNVIAPQSAAAESKPVMIFIHGGGFIYGSGSDDLYRGTGLPAQGDVVLVTVNYRLGALGFLAHASFKDKDGNVGNYGIRDQIAAMKWVKDNIKNFGGDPNNITIFGESAGGMSVGIHLMSPASAGLFNKAIIQSGPTLILNTSLESGEKTGDAAAEKLGCKDPATAAKCLRGLDAVAVLKGAPTGIFFLAESESNAKFPFAPVVDGKIIPETLYMAFEKGHINKNVSVMLGSNSDEATYFILNKKLDTAENFQDTLKTDAAAMEKALDIKLDTSKLSTLYPMSDYASPRKAYTDVFTDMAFTCTTREHADMLYNGGINNIYLYYFSKAPVETGSFKEWGAFHGSELSFIYNKFEFMGIKFPSKNNAKVSKNIIALWSSFARTGTPAGEGLPEWPKYEPAGAKYMHIDTEMATGGNLRTEKCQYFRPAYKLAFDR